MAGSPSFMKRQKELARQERQKEKAAKKQDRTTNNKDGKPILADGEDPDIAGIIPGPQPILDME